MKLKLKTIDTPYQLIDDARQLEYALEPFKSARILGIDFETTGLDPYTA